MSTSGPFGASALTRSQSSSEADQEVREIFVNALRNSRANRNATLSNEAVAQPPPAVATSYRNATASEIHRFCQPPLSYRPVFMYQQQASSFPQSYSYQPQPPMSFQQPHLYQQQASNFLQSYPYQPQQPMSFQQQVSSYLLSYPPYQQPPHNLPAHLSAYQLPPRLW
jgi:hypothetical protein